MAGTPKCFTRSNCNGGVRQSPSAQTDNGDRAVQRFIDCTGDQDRAGRVNGDRQEFADRQAIR